MPKRQNGRKGVTPEEIKQRLATAVEVPHGDVLVGYLRSNQATASFQDSLEDLREYDLFHGGQRIGSKVRVRAGALSLPESRNEVAKALLANGKLQWLFMLDSDMGFAPDTLERLLAVADPESRPVVGALCFAMRELGGDGMGGMQTFPSSTIMQWSDLHQEDGEHRFVGVSHYPVNAMIPAGATGAACILIHRSVLQKMVEKFGAVWFDRVPDAQPGRYMGEDVSFCWRMKELDIPLYIHTGIRTTHMKAVWLGEQDFWQSQIAPPAEERCDIVVPYFGGRQAEDHIPLLVKSARATSGLVSITYVLDESTAIPAQLEAFDVKVLRTDGTFAQKVNYACHFLNLIRQSAPWLLPVYESARFRPGWLDKAQEVAAKYGAQVVGTNDLIDKRVMTGEASPMAMVRCDYIDRVGGGWDGPGVVFHEDYTTDVIHEELVNAARLRGTFQPALGAHIEYSYPRLPQDEAAIRRDALKFQSRLREQLKPEAGNKTPLRVVGLPSEDQELAEV